MISRLQKSLIYMVWVLIVPIGLYYVANTYPPLKSIFSFDAALFILLICVVSFVPIMINGFPIFFIQGVSLAVFLNFGLFAELLISQIGIVTLLIKLRLPKAQWFRYPMNSLMFFTISLVSGLFYYKLGGQTEHVSLSDAKTIWLIIGYQVVGYLTNQLFVHVIDLSVYKKKINLFSKGQILELVSTVIVFPIGLLLFLTYQELGIISVVIVGIPLVSTALVLNLYYNTELINSDLQKASAIGHQLTARLKIAEVADLFLEELSKMFPVDQAYILCSSSKNELRLLRYYGSQQQTISGFETISFTEGIVGAVWRTQKAAMFQSEKEIGSLRTEYIPKWAESIVAVPISKGSSVEGVVLLISGRKYAFDNRQLTIIDLLSSYFASALENARHYEEAKQISERCSLTKLYNYHYLENMLKVELDSVQRGKRSSVTLIIIDLDHFKSINDNYGHQSGNEILCQIAERLTSLVAFKGVATRYGGEEFVLVLPDVSKEKGFEFAEQVRQAIANKPFTLHSDLALNRTQVFVRVTASIGVATAPEDATDPQELIRHADRAMYTGAKRAGRNKVAEYVK